MGLCSVKHLPILHPGPAGPGCKLLDRGQLLMTKESGLKPLIATARRPCFEALSRGAMDRQVPRSGGVLGSRLGPQA